MNEKNNTLKIITLDTIDSTNDYAFDLAKKSRGEIVVVRAHHQTQGRGRRDNTWSSPKNTGIYVSFLLKPDNCLTELIWLPLFFSYAASCCLEPTVKASIKWPNDILVNGKKIGGVLVEAKSANDRADFAIAGIGLNINTRLEQLPEGATSLYVETKESHNIDMLFEKLLTSVLDVYKEFKKGNIESLLTKALSITEQKQKTEEIIQKYTKRNIKDLIILR